MYVWLFVCVCLDIWCACLVMCVCMFGYLCVNVFRMLATLLTISLVITISIMFITEIGSLCLIYCLVLLLSCYSHDCYASAIDDTGRDMPVMGIQCYERL